MLYPNGSALAPKVSSPFGPRKSTIPGASTNHMGVDVVGFRFVCAIAAGVVVRVGRYSGWAAGGVMVWIDHGNGVISRYLHLASTAVVVGQHVAEGQAVAVMGNTSTLSIAVHLHLELVVNGRQIDPMPYIAARLTPATPASNSSRPFEQPTKQKEAHNMLLMDAPAPWGGNDRVYGWVTDGDGANAIDANLFLTLKEGYPVVTFDRWDKFQTYVREAWARTSRSDHAVAETVARLLDEKRLRDLAAPAPA